MDAEHRDFCQSIQSRLNQNRSGSAACTKKRHLSSGQIITGVFCCKHISGSIGCVPGQNPMIIYDGIDCTGNFSSRGEFVTKLAHFIFVRHGQIETTYIHGTKSLYGSRKFFCSHIKCKVDVIQSEMLKRSVVHHRRDTVCNRASKKSGESCTSGNLFHKRFPPVLDFICVIKKCKIRRIYITLTNLMQKHQVQMIVQIFLVQ